LRWGAGEGARARGLGEGLTAHPGALPCAADGLIPAANTPRDRDGRTTPAGAGGCASPSPEEQSKRTHPSLAATSQTPSSRRPQRTAAPAPAPRSRRSARPPGATACCGCPTSERPRNSPAPSCVLATAREVQLLTLPRGLNLPKPLLQPACFRLCGHAHAGRPACPPPVQGDAAHVLHPCRGHDQRPPPRGLLLCAGGPRIPQGEGGGGEGCCCPLGREGQCLGRPAPATAAGGGGGGWGAVPGVEELWGKARPRMLTFTSRILVPMPMLRFAGGGAAGRGAAQDGHAGDGAPPQVSP
jgi:hypothetical protein